MAALCPCHPPPYPAPLPCASPDQLSAPHRLMLLEPGGYFPGVPALGSPQLAASGQQLSCTEPDGRARTHTPGLQCRGVLMGIAATSLPSNTMRAQLGGVLGAVGVPAAEIQRDWLSAVLCAPRASAECPPPPLGHLEPPGPRGQPMPVMLCLSLFSCRSTFSETGSMITRKCEYPTPSLPCPSGPLALAPLPLSPGGWEFSPA